jgi:hypothetical protein
MASVGERWEELKGQFVAWMAEGAKDLHNQIVPAFPTYTHGVDQPGTPTNMGPPEKPSFDDWKASHAPTTPEPAPSPEKGIEL